MRRQEFHQVFGAMLEDSSAQRELPPLEPDTHLWLAGYIDSLALLEVLSFLEDLLDREIELDRGLLRNLTTMNTTYDAYVAPKDPCGTDASPAPAPGAR